MDIKPVYVFIPIHLCVRLCERREESNVKFWKQ